VPCQYLNIVALFFALKQSQWECLMIMNAMLMGINLGLINVMKIMSRMKKKSDI